MIKKYFTTFWFFLIYLFSIAQTKDYKSVRDSLTNLSCGKADSATLNQTQIRLEKFDVNSVTNNRHIYFADLGWCYYRQYLKTFNRDFLYRATEAYEKSLKINPHYSTCLWNIAFCEYLLCNCEKGDKYIERYKIVCPKEFYDESQIKLMREKCGR